MPFTRKKIISAKRSLRSAAPTTAVENRAVRKITGKRKPSKRLHSNEDAEKTSCSPPKKFKASRSSEKSVDSDDDQDRSREPSETPSESSSSLSWSSDSGEQNAGSGPVIKDLQICPPSCRCPPPVTWYGCPNCTRIYRTRAEAKSHREAHDVPMVNLVEFHNEKNDLPSSRSTSSESLDEDYSEPEEIKQEVVDDGDSSGAETILVKKRPKKIYKTEPVTSSKTRSDNGIDPSDAEESNDLMSSLNDSDSD